MLLVDDDLGRGGPQGTESHLAFGLFEVVPEQAQSEAIQQLFHVESNLQPMSPP
ncbi:MAG TPA: hypothetical protein VNV65_04890 [Candidatus Solibacter sp.]|nr:hypothetical protein [Candidatus Solibacter sp.]